jgi:hypothetical protein
VDVPVHVAVAVNDYVKDNVNGLAVAAHPTPTASRWQAHPGTLPYFDQAFLP